MDERVWVEEDWTIRKTNLALSYTLQIFLGHACLTNCPEEEVRISLLQRYCYLAERYMIW